MFHAYPSIKVYKTKMNRALSNCRRDHVGSRLLIKSHFRSRSFLWYFFRPLLLLALSSWAGGREAIFLFCEPSLGESLGIYDGSNLNEHPPSKIFSLSLFYSLEYLMKRQFGKTFTVIAEVFISALVTQIWHVSSKPRGRFSVFSYSRFSMSSSSPSILVFSSWIVFLIHPC